jgi:AcrR family transcriptional regulator
MDDSSNTKREQLIRTGKELFWKFGFRRVTVEEICSEAGISKMTFYKYFSNKLDLVKTIMDEILTHTIERYREIVDSDLPYPEKVTQLIELKREQVQAMSNEFFRDYVQSADREMSEYLQQITQKNMQMILADFYNAQKNGDIRKDLKVEFIMYVMNQLIEMTHDDRLLHMYENPEDLVMEITNFLFYGILSREHHP